MNGTMLLAGITLLAGAAVAAAGEEASYTFAKPPVDSMGVKSLAELRGKPVLIDFWGTR